MPALETLTFATPMALAALVLLPAIWWLLRFTPPRPASVRFAPFRLLLDLVSREEETDKTPWWLVVLRLALAGLVIVAVARPLLSDPPAALTNRAPVLIVIDDSWAAAHQWDKVLEALNGIIDASERASLPVGLATTTLSAKPGELDLATARTVRERAAALEPRAQHPDRLAILKRLESIYGAVAKLNVVWLADGIDHGHAAAFAAGLQALANGTADVRAFIVPQDQLKPVLAAPKLEDGKLKFAAVRAATDRAQDVVVELQARNGRSLADARLSFSGSDTRADGEIVLPLELRNDAAALHIAGERSAGAVYLLDDRWRRKAIGLMSGASLELEQPLLSPLYYVSRALQPSAELFEIRSRAGLRERLDAGLSMLVLADVGNLAPSQSTPISDWVKDGGVLVRFAGPRLASRHDDLVPVELRTGGRALGSALSWEQPQRLALFPQNSPFSDLKPDATVTVKRQVLAQPSPELTGRVWASLEDGTPLITANKHGNGLIILFHVTANGDWSNLPFSGQFVELLRRILDLAPGIGATGIGASSEVQTGAGDITGAFVPVRALSGFGTLTAPPVDAAPIAAKSMARASVSPIHPAGLYRRAGASRALNLAMPADRISAIPALPAAITIARYETRPAIALAGPIFVLAFCLFLADCIAALFLSGAWYRLKLLRGTAAVLLGLLLAGGIPDGARAQDIGLSAADRFALHNVSETRLAYVKTGRKSIDDISFAGLTGLTGKLIQRTSVEPALPTGIDIEQDEIVFFPLLYWPVVADAKPLSENAIAKIDKFMKNGGTIFFDTRDSQSDIINFTGQPSKPTLAMRRILASLDIPRLIPVPPEHVLTKAFYLLQTFPGRWADGNLWVEDNQQPGRESSGNSDGVTSIIIGSNDYAAAWAQDLNGRALFPVVPGGERQREFAVRTGINTVMYALTGNYKADQVHVPALLERLGQ